MASATQVATIFVVVQDVRGAPLEDASVRLRPADGTSETLELRYDEGLSSYTLAEIPAGEARLEVEHPGFEPQTREVRLDGGPNRELFIMAAPGVRTYFREKVRVPVDADPDLIAATLVRDRRTDVASIDEAIRGLGLVRERGPELAERAGVHLFRISTDAPEAVARLAAHPLVEHAGAVVSLRERGFSHLTQEIVVRFRGPRAEAVRAIGEEYGYAVVRELPYAPNTYVLRWNRPATLDILDSIERIAARNDVEWAEPSLVVTPEVDSITPTDTLWPGCWDRQLIGCPDAWQHLKDAGLEQYGDPDILLAIWDSGVQSQNGSPTNQDFAGTVSTGQSKVARVFDFDHMVANNDNPWSDHGSGVAGVSAALADNPPVAGGHAYGLAGSAPNVRIMTIEGRTPYVDIEVADQYLWMAGFDPQSPLTGFPTWHPTPGADVITCSLTPGAGAPLSGTARAMLDFVTTFGRHGKGTLLFFSTGNQNQNNVTARPYGAYEKCFGIAGTSIGNDGVTEIRYPWSGWGQIALSAPTQDDIPTVHNPPTGYMPWGAAEAGNGNLPSTVQGQTTLTASSVAGATSLTVSSVAGLAANTVIHLGPFGAVGSEPARISAVNAATHQITVQGYNGWWGGGLLNAHQNGSVVVYGPPNHRNDFGGTSSATPLAAGAAALVLSANPALTFVEAREILRNTAHKIDLANTDPNGRWLDANGNPSTTSGLPPVRSGWYGYGRVDVGAAVQQALSWAFTRDLVIRDSLVDAGTVPSGGSFWNSPDVWCRRLAPASDPGAVPAGYAAAGPHQDPLRGQDNWIYARVHNRGSEASLDGWVRLSITHYPGMEYTWPASFEPINGPGDPVPTPMVPGTYFIGEAKVTHVPPGGDQIVSVVWPKNLIPPEVVATPAGQVHWHPCLLAEITPHDGPAPTGAHVWDDNNLAQKNISIVGIDWAALLREFRVAVVVGHHFFESGKLVLEIQRGRLPASVQLYVDLIDPVLTRRIRLNEREILTEPVVHGGRIGPVGTRTVERTGLELAGIKLRPDWSIETHDDREVIFVRSRARAQIPIYTGLNRLTTIVVGGFAGRETQPGTYDVVLVQRSPSGEVMGSAGLQVTVR